MATTVAGVGIGFGIPCSSKLTQTTSSCSVKMVMLCVEGKKKKQKNSTLKKSKEASTADASKIACSYELSKTVQKLGTSSIKCKIIHTHLRREKIMESSPLTKTPTLLISSSPSTPTTQIYEFPISRTNPCLNQTFLSYSTTLYATLNSPRGFGPTPKKVKQTKKSKTGNDNDDEVEEEDEEPEEGIIPEIVTNRMISRMGFSVGIPLFVGLLFFPFFYYLKVVLKIDVPTWVPFIVSFVFFGTALLGVSYGIVSSSWDPMREGSLLGWNEAQRNWPVFWQSLWGGSRKK